MTPDTAIHRTKQDQMALLTAFVRILCTVYTHLSLSLHENYVPYGRCAHQPARRACLHPLPSADAAIHRTKQDQMALLAAFVRILCTVYTHLSLSLHENYVPYGRCAHQPASRACLNPLPSADGVIPLIFYSSFII